MRSISTRLLRSRHRGDFEFDRITFVNPDGVPSQPDPDHATRINNERTQHGATLGAGAALGPGRLRFSDFFVHSQGGEPGFDDDSASVIAGQNPRADSTDWSNLAQLRYASEALMLPHGGRARPVPPLRERDFHDPLREQFGLYTT